MSDKRNSSTGHMDERENHIRRLAMIMTKAAIPSHDCEEYLRNREYGLALAALAEDVIHGR